MKKKVTYKEIAEIIGKNEQTIKGWKQRSPALLEIVKLGAFCKINNITQEKLLHLSKVQQLLEKEMNN